MIFVILLAALVIISGVGVVTFKSPINSALSLISNMVLLALIYFNLGAEFLALSQMVVYAGAIMVLVIFVIMLLNLNYGTNEKNVLYRSIVPISIAFIFLGVFYPIAKGEFNPTNFNSKVSDTKELGRLLFSDYTFPFEVTSILILAALLGAVVLAKVKHD